MAFATWMRDCGFSPGELMADLPALWHYCRADVVGACTTLVHSLKERLFNQGLEERKFPVRALETLEAAESRACLGGIISSCEFTIYYAHLLEVVAGFPSDLTIRQVESALQSLCELSHPGACGEVGLRLASAGRVERNPNVVTEGVRLLSRACIDGEVHRCSQLWHFEEEAGRDVAHAALRKGCGAGELASCIYLFENPADERDRVVSKHFLMRSCRNSIPGQIDQMGLRACAALNRTAESGSPTRARNRL